MDLDQIQLNRHLCNYLSKTLEMTKIVVECHKRGSIGRETNSCQRAFREVELVVKRAEDLLSKCMCESSWITATITLGNVKEEVLDIQLDLHFWGRMLKIANIYASMGEATILPYVEKVVKKNEDLHKKLLEVDSHLQKAAEDDTSHLLLKLLEVKEKHASCGERSTTGVHEREYILSMYLLSWLKEDRTIATEVEPQLKMITWGTPLGRGSYGYVSAATWWDWECAVKTVQVTDDGQESAEAKISRDCHHPHIVQCFWSYQMDNSSYIIMERMQEDLSTYIKHLLLRREQRDGGRPFEWHVAIDIMLQIAKAISYLHNKKPQKIVHRDLKTSNILVQPLADNSQGHIHVKLADFGISKCYNMTETSALTFKKGTNVYAAPEVFHSESKHGNSSSKLPLKLDVWSFAMVCSEILTGTVPFDGEQRGNLHAKIAEDDEFRPPLPSDCPEDLRYCITRCWVCDPQKRPKFGDICKMLKLAKAQSLGIIQFNSCELLFPAPTLEKPTSREPQASGSAGDLNTQKTESQQKTCKVEQISSLATRGLNPQPLSDPEVVDPVEGKQGGHGNGANESSISSSEIGVPSYSVMAVYEGIHAYPDVVHQDQALEGDIRNPLAPGAPSSWPTTEPQAQGVALPKTGPTVATSATVLLQGTIDVRSPTSPQPMMIMWNEDERTPQDPSTVNRTPLPRHLALQHCRWCGGEGHQLGACHYYPSLMDERMDEQIFGQTQKSSIPPTIEPAPQNEARSTGSQSVNLDLLSGLGVGLLQSKMATTTVQPALPKDQPAPPMKWSTEVIQERALYPTTVPVVVPPHGQMQHSTRTGMGQMTWPPYREVPTSMRRNLSLDVQPLLATGLASGSNVDKEAGLENGPQHCHFCGEEGHQFRENYKVTSLMDEWMHGHFQNSSIPPTVEPAQTEARAFDNQSVILDLLSEMGESLPQSGMVTTTIQPSPPTNRTKQVTQEIESHPATVLPPQGGTQHSTGMCVGKMTQPPYRELPTPVRPNLPLDAQPPAATTDFAGGSNFAKEGGFKNGPQHYHFCGEEGHQFRGCHHLTSVMDERVHDQSHKSSIPSTTELAPAVSSQNEAKVISNQLVTLDLLSELGIGLPQSRIVTNTVQPAPPTKQTTQVMQESDRYPAAVPAVLAPHGGKHYSIGTTMGSMTWPPSSMGPNLLLHAQPSIATGFASGSNKQKEAGLEHGLEHHRFCGEGHQFRRCHYLTSLMDERMLQFQKSHSLPPTTEPTPVVSSQNEAIASGNQLVILDLLSEIGVGLSQSGMDSNAIQPTPPTNQTTQVTQEKEPYPAIGQVVLPPHSGMQHSTRTSMGKMAQLPYGELLTSVRPNLPLDVQTLVTGFAGGSNLNEKGGQKNGPQHCHFCGGEGHQFRGCHYKLPSPMDGQIVGQFSESSMLCKKEPAPMVSSQIEARAPGHQLVDLNLLSEFKASLPQTKMDTTTVQPTTPTKGTTPVTQEKDMYPATVQGVLPPCGGTQHSAGMSTLRLRASLLNEGLADFVEPNLSSAVQAPGAGFARGNSNVEKEGGLENVSVDDGQQQQEDLSKFDSLFQNGLCGVDFNPDANMGWNAAQNPTLKLTRVQIAPKQDKLMAQDTEPLAKEEEKKKIRAGKKEMNVHLNQPRHDLKEKQKLH